MPHKEKNKGNRNAALPPGERHRVAFMVSLSGKRLLPFGNLSDDEIAKVVRKHLDGWSPTMGEIQALLAERQKQEGEQR